MATQEATEDATPAASATTAPALLGAVITPAQAAADGVARARAAAAAAAPPTAAERRANLDVAPAGPLPKKKAAGRRVAWTDDERLCLCKGWLKTTLDPVLGTNQTNKAFWNAMVDSSRNAMIEARLPGLEKRLERSDRIIERTFRYDITNATHRLNACRISAVKQQLTGALTEEDLDMAAVALYNDKGPYQGIRREESAIKCDFISCWRFLRVHPKFSTESAVEHMKLAGYKVSGEVVDVSDGDDNCVSLTPNKRRATGDADRFVGTKAAKAAFRSDISLERESAAHTAALNSLAKSSAERNELAKRKHTIEFWSMPHVRDTAQGKAFWENQLDARLAEDSGRTAAAGHLDTAASTVAAATPPSTAADARTTAAGTASTAATSLRASEVSDEATIEGTVSRSTSMTAAAPGAAARSDSIAPKSLAATSARRSAAAAAAASPRNSTAAASTTGSRGGEAASPGAFTVPMSESPADTAAMAAARADEAAAEATRRRAEADEVLANAEAQRRAIEVATAAAADAKDRVAAAERLAHAKAQRLNAERRVCTGRYHLTDGDVSKAAAADVAAAKMAAAHSSAAANMAAAHMSVAANMAGAHKSAAATRNADVTVSDTTRLQAAAVAALAAATKRQAAVQEQLNRDKAAVAQAAAALAAVVESADEKVIDMVELVDDDDRVVNGPRLRASRGAHGGNNKCGSGKRVVGMGDGDRGYGHMGGGEKGDGDQSDGHKDEWDKGEGDKGKGDQCEGDNGDGDEGDGNKGDGDKGDGDRGDGDKVDGDQGDVAAAALVTAPRRRGAHTTAAMRTKQAAWGERRRTSEMSRNGDLALRRVAAEVDGSWATASSQSASLAATEADGNSASAAAPHSTSAAFAADGSAGAAAALTMPGQAGHGPAASLAGGAARLSAAASPNRAAEIADADKELEDAESLGDDTEVAYEDNTLYLGTPSPPSSRRQRFRSCSSGRRPPLPPRQTANSSSESDKDSDADMSF